MNDIKRDCVTAIYEQNKDKREIYEHWKEVTGNKASYDTFTRATRKWRSQLETEDTVTSQGLLPDGIMKNATIQVDKNGELVQAWIKQEISDDFEKLIDTVKTMTPIELEYDKVEKGSNLLEIPLLDMHWGINHVNDYRSHLSKIIEIMEYKHRDKIIFIIGQDLFHNNDFRGGTSNYTPIEKVDIPRAWQEAYNFYYTMIIHAIENASEVEIIYSRGNHDEALAWAFCQMLEKVFPTLKFDTKLDYDKVRTYGKCFVGWSHGDEGKKNKTEDIRGVFAESFKREWARTNVREIHLGHLHHEVVKDAYGFTCRRLSTAAKTDDWHKKNDYVNNHKRFMVFEYDKNYLECIYYLN